MKKKGTFLLTALVLVLAFVVFSCNQQENAPVSASSAGGAGGGSLQLKPGTDFNGPHFNLNIIGVPQDKINGNFDNTDRHTIFIPLVTDFTTDPCLTTGTRQETEYPVKGVQLRIGPSGDDNFYVVDGNATDDKYAEFLMPAATNGYDVYLAGKGKPGGCLDIDAYTDTLATGGLGYIGHVDVDRKTGAPKWQKVNFLLYDNSGLPYFADPNIEYWWQLYNNGLRLLSVRFYPTGS